MSKTTLNNSRAQSDNNQIITWLEQHAIPMMRISIGIIYLLFGALKFAPHYSPAEELAGNTIFVITMGMIEPPVSLWLLAFIETVIGIGLIFKIQLKWMIVISLWHMGCTFLPMFLLPGYTFTEAPVSISLVGQYIIKNLIIVSALLVIWIHERKTIG